MAKRFIDSNYFNDPFILSLKKDNKLLYIYFWTICDHAGIFELNEVLGNFHLDCKDFKERVIKFSKEFPDKIVQLDETHFIVMSFCKRQYPNGVNTKVRQIQGALTILESWDVEIINNQTFTLRVNKGYKTLDNSYGSGSGNGIGNGEGGMGGDLKLPKKTWRDDFEIYKNMVRENYNIIIKDQKFLSQQQKFYPNLDLVLSIQKSCINFWATEAGWKNKKSSRSKTLDWKSTFANALSQKTNQVYKSNGTEEKPAYSLPKSDFKGYGKS